MNRSFKGVDLRGFVPLAGRLSTVVPLPVCAVGAGVSASESLPESCEAFFAFAFLLTGILCE